MYFAIPTVYSSMFGELCGTFTWCVSFSPGKLYPLLSRIRSPNHDFFPHFVKEVQNLQYLEGNSLIHKIRVMLSRELFETEWCSFCLKDPE